MGWDFLRKLNGFKGINKVFSLCENIGKKSLVENFNWHQRKIFFVPFFRALILSQIDNTKSLRDLGKKVSEDPVYSILGAQMEVSVPALSMTLAKKEPDAFVKILDGVLQIVRSLGVRKKTAREVTNELNTIKDMLTNVKIFDSTTCELSHKLSEWAKYDDDQAGIRLHLKLDKGYGGLEKVMITSAKDNDSKYFKDLLDLEHDKEKIYLFDCGYRNFKVYHKITRSGNYFVTKFHSQNHYNAKETLCDKEKNLQNGWKSISDQKIILGKDEELHDVVYRLIIAQNPYGKIIKILTNIFNCSQEQIIALYSYRWTIEIVFRWLKHALKMKKFISTSPNGVIIQIVIALIIYCILIINQNQGRKTISPKTLLLELEITTHWMLLMAGIFIGMDICKKNTTGR